MIPQLIISLSPSGDLVAELPGLNGARRKINLVANQQSNSAISFASQVLRDISNLSASTTGITDATKASDLLNLLQNKMKSAADAANQISNLENQDNTICDILLRILNGQVSSKSRLGEDGAPTKSQITHWQKHGALCEDKDCVKNKRGERPHSHEMMWSDPSCPHCISEGRFDPGYNRERAVKGLSEHEAIRCGLISRGYTEAKNKTKSGIVIWSKPNMGDIHLLPNGKIQDHKHVEWLKDNRNALIQDGKIHAKQFGFKPIEVTKRSGTQVKKLVTMAKTTPQEKATKKLGNISF